MSSPFLGLPRLFWILWTGQFVNRLGGFVLTFLPLFLTEHHRYTDAQAGAVLSLFGLGSLAGASLGGWSSDRFGRRPTVLAFALANATVLLVFGLAPPGPALAVMAVLHGLSNGYGPALSAAVTDVVSPPDRARAYGYFYWAVNLGFAAAALMGGALSRLGYVWLFVGDACTTLAFAAIVWRLVPETRPAGAAVEKAGGRGPRALADPRMWAFLAGQFLTLLVFLQSFVTLPLEERARGVPVGHVGLIAALNGVIIVALQPAFVRASRGRPLWSLLCLAAALVGASAVLAERARSASGFVAAMALVTLGEIAFSGAAPAFVAHVAPVERRGTYQGAYSLCWAAASLLAPLAGPGLRARFGSGVMWLAGAAVCALALAVHATGTRRAEGDAGVTNSLRGAAAGR